MSVQDEYGYGRPDKNFRLVLTLQSNFRELHWFETLEQALVDGQNWFGAQIYNFNPAIEIWESGELIYKKDLSGEAKIPKKEEKILQLLTDIQTWKALSNL